MTNRFACQQFLRDWLVWSLPIFYTKTRMIFACRRIRWTLEFITVSIYGVSCIYEGWDCFQDNAGRPSQWHGQNSAPDRHEIILVTLQALTMPHPYLAWKLNFNVSAYIFPQYVALVEIWEKKFNTTISEENKLEICE